MSNRKYVRRGASNIEKIQFHTSTDANGCWLWTAYVDECGYGIMYANGKQGQKAHRVSYEAHVGPIPEGLHIDHLCRVRHCVNPDHLEPVTQRENNLRGQGIGVKHAAVTHCPRGHEYVPENTYVWKARRNCRTCHRHRSTEWAREKRRQAAARGA